MGILMKLTLALMIAGALALTACKPEEKEAPAQTPPAEEAAANAQSHTNAATPDHTPGAVAEALDGIISFNGKPSADADYYIYLQSASWCPPCRAEMPEIVKMYPEMKDSKVELILIGCDDSPESSLKYLQDFGAGFPGIHYKEDELKNLPGYSPASGIPDATFVDKEGHVIYRGHGSLIKRWKQIFKKEAATPATQDSAPEEPAA